jgi:sec-independent protein translocase protein TatB
MFGMSFGEIVLIVIVGIVVIGPKDMPKVLRKAGQWAGKLRRMAFDLRSQSGIDDALRMEGLSDDIAEIRKLARGELDGVQRSVRGGGFGGLLSAQTETAPAQSGTPERDLRTFEDALTRGREYPWEGADSYGAIPDFSYLDYPLPPSTFAREALYLLGDPDAQLPPDPLASLRALDAQGLDAQAGVLADAVDVLAAPASEAQAESTNVEEGVTADAETTEGSTVSALAPSASATDQDRPTPIGPAEAVGADLADQAAAARAGDSSEPAHHATGETTVKEELV